MKIWIKLLIGTVLGTILGVYLPIGGETGLEWLSLLSEFTISIGRYVLYPLMFFSAAVGAYKLKQGKNTLKVTLKSVIYLILFSAILAALGTLSVLLLSPARIPIIIEHGSPLKVLNIVDTVRLLFPRNLFLIFGDQGNFLLPTVFLGFILGLNLTFDNISTRPVREFFDGASRILFHINDLMVEVMGIGMIALMAYLVVELRSTPSLEMFSQLLVILLIDLIVIAFGLIPLVFFFFIPGRQNPYKFLYALLAPALAALVSGDNYFSMIFLIKSGNANLGIPRRVGSFTYPLFALFGKAGTALVTGTAFVVILKSYSSLGITAGGVIWVMVFSFLLSFITGSYPALGFLASISLMCGLYGQGLEEGYLILTPIVPLLVRASVFLNVMVSGAVSFLVADQENLRKEIELANYV